MKILYNKKDSALIQLSDGNQAQLGEFLLTSIGLQSRFDQAMMTKYT